MGNRFKDLIVWQKAYQLTLSIYQVTESFPQREQYGLTAQIRRAALSVPANIAEGHERRSRKEYVQFLSIAKGSLGELETFLLLSKDLGFLPDNKFEATEAQCHEVSRLLHGLIRALEK